METGKITIKRDIQFKGKWWKIPVYLDGEKLYKFKTGEERTFDLTEGEHQIYIKSGMGKSNVMNIIVNKNETKQIDFGFTIRYKSR